MKLIILRGPSGCGKSSTAEELAGKIKNSCIVAQDTFRIDVLKRNQDAPHILPSLLLENVLHLREKELTVILEGTLTQEFFGDTIKILADRDDAKLYYLQCSRETAVERINDIRKRVGGKLATNDDLDVWYSKSQKLNHEKEIAIDTEAMSHEDAVSLIYKDILG